MKILLITDLYPLANSSEPKTILYFAQEWTNQGHTVDVIRPNFLLNTVLRKKKTFETKVFEEENIKIFNVNYITPFLFNIKNKLPNSFSLTDYDVVISHMPSGTIFASKLIGNSKIPFICSVHSSDIEVLTNKPYKIYFAQKLKKAYQKATLISPRSFVLKEKIESLIPQTKDKTFVAYSGVDENIIEEKLSFIQKGQDIYNTKKLKIVTVASLIKRKNVDIILKALAKIDFCDWEYTIIGSGKKLNNLQNLAIKLGINDRVKFTHSISQNKVFEILKDSNMFILLSEKETFGMAYLEAMAKGNIIISTKNDGIDGIIQNNINGFTCYPNTNDLIETVKRIIDLPYTNIENICINSYNTILKYTRKNAAENYINSILNEMPQLSRQ